MAFETNRVAYWKFDESSGNAVDSSGNGNTLVAVNTPTFDTGKVDNATLLVEASSQYFKITDANQTGLGLTGDCSISFFLKLTAQPGTGETMEFCNKSDEDADERAYSYYYYDTGGEKHLRFVVGNDSGANDLYDIVLTLPTGDWCHVLMTWDASEHTARFYLNELLAGMSVGTVGLTTIDTGTGDFSVGAYTDSNWTTGLYYVDGMLDEFMIWSRVISKEEIRKYLLSVNIPYLPLPAFFN